MAKVVDVRFEPVGTFMGVVSEKKIVLILDDGTENNLGRYFTDEKSFSASDFVGLTLDQSVRKFLKIDVDYLRS